MTGFKSKWVTVNREFMATRVPEIAVALRLKSYSAYDGPGCAIVVPNDPAEEALLREQAEEMEVPPPKLTLFAKCIHRGLEVGTTPCESCGGNVRVKLFACAVHGICVLAKRGIKAQKASSLDGPRTEVEVPVCEGCQDRA